MQKILEGHGQIQGIVQLFQLPFLHFCKSVKGFYIFRLLKIGHQSLRLLHARLPGVHRIDAVIFDGREFFVCDVAFDHIGGGRPDDGLLILLQKLYALYRGIRPLVKLSRQIFHRKYPRAGSCLKIFSVQIIHRRLGKYAGTCLLKNLVGNILHIIADQHPHTCHTFNSQIAADLMLQILCLHREIRLFLRVNSSYTAHLLCPFLFFGRMAIEGLPQGDSYFLAVWPIPNGMFHVSVFTIPYERL